MTRDHLATAHLDLGIWTHAAPPAFSIQQACEKESSDEGRLEAAVGTGADINVSAKTNSSGLTKSTDGRISNTIRGSGGVMGALEVAAVAGGDRAAGGNGGERGAELTAGKTKKGNRVCLVGCYCNIAATRMQMSHLLPDAAQSSRYTRISAGSHSKPSVKSLRFLSLSLCLSPLPLHPSLKLENSRR